MYDISDSLIAKSICDDVQHTRVRVLKIERYPSAFRKRAGRALGLSTRRLNDAVLCPTRRSATGGTRVRHECDTTSGQTFSFP